MDITKDLLCELNITGIHDRPVKDGKTRSCWLLYDLIEGNLNKEHIKEWAGLQVSQIFNLRVLLKVASKKNIHKTLSIIQSCNSTKEAAKKLSEEYGYSPVIHELILEMPRNELLLVQDKEEVYNQLLKRREILYSSLLHLTKISDLIND